MPTADAERTARLNTILTVTSLLSILFFSFHVADDIMRGYEPGTSANFGAFPIFAVWMYATLVLAGRRWGYALIFLGNLLSMAVPILHMKGKGVGVATSIPASEGGFFFVWILLAIGTTALFSLILAARLFWADVRAARA